MSNHIRPWRSKDLKHLKKVPRKTNRTFRRLKKAFEEVPPLPDPVDLTPS